MLRWRSKIREDGFALWVSLLCNLPETGGVFQAALEKSSFATKMHFHYAKWLFWSHGCW